MTSGTIDGRYFYVYNYETDFTNLTSNTIPDIKILIHNIKQNITTVYSHINFNNETMDFFFNTELTSLEKTTLDSIVSSYTFTPRLPQPEKLEYECYVSNDPIYPGDYSSIKAAFDSGKKSVFVRGTGLPYFETGNITIPEEGQLYGEFCENVIIDFQDNSYSIVTPYYPIENRGTNITLTNDSFTLTGLNTFFTETNQNVDLYVNVFNHAYKVDQVISNTSLTLKTKYFGRTTTTNRFYISNYVSGIYIQNITIQNSSSKGLNLNNCFNFKLQNIDIKNCNPNINIDNCCGAFMNNVITRYSKSDGIIFCDSSTVVSNDLISNNNNGDGIRVVSELNYCENYSFGGSTVNDNKKNGVVIGGDIVSKSKIVMLNFTESKVRNNFLIGINIECHDTPAPPYFKSCRGINVSGCTVTTNGSTGIKNKSTYSKFTGLNVGGNVGGGIICGGQDNIISDNLIFYNTGNGIYISENSISHIVSENVIRNNTGNGLIVDKSIGTILNANRCFTNSQNGVSFINNCSDINVTSNVLSNNLYNGLIITGINSNMNISSNNMKSNSLKGIKLSDETNKLIVTSNIVADNTEEGIFIDSTTYSKILIGMNVLSNNIINVPSSSEIVLVNNLV